MDICWKYGLSRGCVAGAGTYTNQKIRAAVKQQKKMSTNPHAMHSNYKKMLSDLEE